MKKYLLIIFFVLSVFLSCCDKNTVTEEIPNEKNGYTQIDAKKAAEIMAGEDEYVILDVRRQDEYDSGHIPGAILVPNEEIGSEMPEELPDLNQIILVYCRTGRRSKEAAEKLAAIGYKNIYEFGGIVDWTGDIVKEEDNDMNETTEAITPSCVLVIEANGNKFYASFENNSSAEALIDKLSSEPLTVEMHDYGDFEKVGSLPWELPTNDNRITTKPGDVILYQGNQITVYYDENTWSFTKLAEIGNATKENLLEAFGSGNVSITFSLEWSE